MEEEYNVELCHKMIAAIKENNDQTLNKLVKEDTGLSSYARVLEWAATYKGGDLAILQKLLDLPVLDKTSYGYKFAAYTTFVEGSFDNCATAYPKRECIDPQILKRLLEEFKDSTKFINSALSGIFGAAAERCTYDISVEAARMLQQSGASVDDAFSRHADVRERHKQDLDRELGAMRRLKAKVTGP